MLNRTQIFFTQSWYSYRALFRDAELKSYIFLKIGQPIFQLLFFVLLAKYCMRTDDLTIRVIGNAFLLCQKNCIHGLGRTFTSERIFGTLKLVIAAPYGKFLSFFEKSFIHIWDALVSVIIGLLVGWLVFGLNLGNMTIIALVLFALMAVFACAGFGLFLGSLGLMSENMLLYNNLVVMVMLTFSGATFPLNWLPNFFKYISFITPTARSISAVELMINGAAFRQVTSLLAGEFLLGFIYILLGYILIRYAENIAKKNASLDLY